MDDGKIIDLYWMRSEEAIMQTSQKYESYCRSISYRILYDEEDTKECVNDTWLRAWNSIPPQHPERLSIFLGKITRNLSIDRYKRRTAAKRGNGQLEIVLSELNDCIPDPQSVEQQVEATVLTESIDEFLAALSATERIVFVQRYWYTCSIVEIAKQYDISESKVKSMLFRLRERLKKHLGREGITV